jgi:hypothetical protein
LRDAAERIVSSRDIAVLFVTHECRRQTIALARKTKLCTDIHRGNHDGTALVSLTHVTRITVLVPLLVLFATGCVGGPVRLRPGSNVALPSTRSVIDELLDSYDCKKRNRGRGRFPGEVARCGPVADGLPSAGATPKQP